MTATVLFVRLGRWGIAGFSAIAFTATFVQTTAFYSLAGHSAADQAAFGASMASIATHFSALFATPVHPETAGGYVWWRGFQAVAILLSVWAMASATAMVRTDEKHGLLESVLANGVPRWVVIGTRALAFAIGAGLVSAAAALGFMAVVQANGGAVEARGFLEAWFLIMALTLSCYGISLLVAQLVTARFATAAAAVVLLALFLVNSLSRTFDWLATLRWISPFRYFDLSQPIVPGGAFDAGSVVVLLAIATVASTAAAFAFERRDLGSPLLVPPARPHSEVRVPSRLALWRWPVVRDLYERRIGFAVWSVGVLLLAVLFVWVTKVTVQPLLNIPALFPYFGRFVRGNLYPTVLGYTWFNFAELLFSAFAIVQVARWSAEDMDGRLELVLSQPRSRAGVVIERMATLVVAASLMAAVSGIALFYASRAQGIDLDPQRVATASAMLIPLALVFAGAGALLAAWRPRAAVGLVGAIAFLGYLDTEVGPLLKWPLWVQDLSPFKLFGTPLLSGLDNRSLALLIAIALVGFGSSILAMQRRDVGA